MVTNTLEFYMAFNEVVESLTEDRTTLVEALDGLGRLQSAANDLGIPFVMDKYEAILRRRAGLATRFEDACADAARYGSFACGGFGD